MFDHRAGIPQHVEVTILQGKNLNMLQCFSLSKKKQDQKFLPCKLVAFCADLYTKMVLFLLGAMALDSAWGVE